MVRSERMWLEVCVRGELRAMLLETHVVEVCACAVKNACGAKTHVIKKCACAAGTYACGAKTRNTSACLNMRML